VILDLGYHSAKDVYVPFRRMTGLTVATVRQLSESQFAALIDGPLALPVPGCRVNPQQFSRPPDTRRL
jgi:hypothetical protein